jgi:sporulation protein YlmC with PRC-barrel domain
MDLLGKQVFDADGRRLGTVHDLRFAAERPAGEPWRIELTGILCGARRSLGHRFGYGQGDMTGPWLLRVAMRWHSRRRLEIDWDQVRATASDRIDLRVRHADITRRKGRRS